MAMCLIYIQTNVNKSVYNFLGVYKVKGMLFVSFLLPVGGNMDVVDDGAAILCREVEGTY